MHALQLSTHALFWGQVLDLASLQFLSFKVWSCPTTDITYNNSTFLASVSWYTLATVKSAENHSTTQVLSQNAFLVFPKQRVLKKVSSSCCSLPLSALLISSRGRSRSICLESSRIPEDVSRWVRKINKNPWGPHTRFFFPCQNLQIEVTLRHHLNCLS